MKRITTSLLGILLFATACHKQDLTEKTQESKDDLVEITERKCGTAEALQLQLQQDPTLRTRMEQVEAYTQKVLQNPGRFRLAADGVIEIPVVVHVVYRTTAQNISDEQVNSQIAVLNEDYNNTNADASLVPPEFKTVQTSVGLRFVLDRIVRKQTSKTSFGTNDGVKKSKMGGSDPVDPSYYLNMWSCNLGQNLLGYAQFPGGSAATDGVVILYSAFGSRDKNPTGTYISKYDLGRTATHEVGHWLNLRHIWGDANCGSDLVDDTPPAATSNYGCPQYPKNTTCIGGKPEMTMNYMDYTDDACMYMFSSGQRSRVMSLFTTSGARASFIRP